MDKKKQKLIRNVILGLAGFTVIIGLGYLLLTWNQPLNSPLDLTEYTDGTDLVIETPENEASNEETVVTLTPTLEPVCGAPPVLNILVSGVASKDYLYGLADAIRVVRVDFQTKEISVLALPRDLWVDIPGLESRGITVGKLNQAFFYGTEGMGYFSGSGYGSGLLAETLYINFGYTADRYVAVNLNSFNMIIDTLGGIDVYLANDVYKNEYEEPVLFLKAGTHHLNGKEAESLARQRITIGDLGRINNQTIILKALALKILSPTGVAALPALIDQLKSNVQTDLSPADISQLVCLAGMLNYEEDINYLSLPTESMLEQMVYDPARGIDTAALVVDKDRIFRLMTEFQSGTFR